MTGDPRARARPRCGRRGRALLAAALAAAVALGGCMRGDDSGGDADSPAEAAAADEGAPTNVPVQVDVARRVDLEVTVSAPGRTEALRQGRVRAPYASRIVSLRVADGDRIKQDQVVAVVVSKNSEAALEGAERMLAAASTAADKADARRAVEVAKANLVQRSLRAPAGGVVLSHAAEAGDYVDEGEVLVTIAETDTVFFNAEVPQSDVARVHAGQAAEIDLPATEARSVDATVHGVLPVASSQNFSAPVRLDFAPPRPDLGLGLFGTARIVVARHPDATVVPEGAVLRDDVTGVTRLAVVGAGDTAHWIDVQTGVREEGRVEIVSPAIQTDTRVITDGQVGLPEGARVSVRQ